MESEPSSTIVSFPSNSQQDRIIREQLFKGDIAEWAKERACKFGDVIVAKHMYIERIEGDRFNAVWLEHQGVDQTTGEPYHLHHIACDCIREEDPNQMDDMILFGCPIVHNALYRRAKMLDKENRLRETLSVLVAAKAEGSPLLEAAYENMVLNIIKEMLLEDKEHPDAWVGNVVSGQHRVELLSDLLNISPALVQIYVGILELRDEVEFDGQTIRLKEAA